jgi:hypothetical protein
LSQGTFTVQESGAVTSLRDTSATRTYHHTSQVTSTRRGALLREVHIAPLNVDSEGMVTLEFQDGASLRAPLCKGRCPETTVTLREMPVNAFYDARDATVEERDPYIDTETISLSVDDLERGIVFAYVRPPFHRLAFLLRPFIGASAASNSALALSGFIGLVIAVPILRPARFQGARQALRGWFGKEEDLEWLAPASEDEAFEGDIRTSRRQRVDLYRLLATRLDETELHALYFGLDVPYNSLTDGGTIDHARELVAYCARTQRLDELLAALAQERPDLDLSEWSDKR